LLIQIFYRTGGVIPFPAQTQKSSNEHVEIPVQYAIHIAGFDAGAQVFDHAIGLQDIRANLGAEVNLELGVFNFFSDRALLFELVFVEARTQHLHRLLTVLVLRALILAGDDDVGGKMRHADGRIGGVDVLAALAAGAIGVDAQILRLDVDFNGVVDFRRDEDAGERGVAALGGIERRDSHQAMHAGFAGEQSIGVFAGDGEGGGLDASYFTGLIVIHLRFETLLLRPAQVHAHQNLGPVLRLRAAGAGMDGDNGVQRIGFFRQHGAGFECVGESAQSFNRPQQIGFDRFAFPRQFKVGGDIFAAAAQFGIVGKQGFKTLAFAHQWLRDGRVGPDGGVGYFLFDEAELFAQAF